MGVHAPRPPGRGKLITAHHDAGGANPSYQGYDYQKLVTVWVSLKLTGGTPKDGQDW